MQLPISLLFQKCWSSVNLKRDYNICRLEAVFKIVFKIMRFYGFKKILQKRTLNSNVGRYSYYLSLYLFSSISVFCCNISDNVLAHMPLLLAKFNSSCLCLKLLWIYFSFWIFSRSRYILIILYRFTWSQMISKNYYWLFSSSWSYSDLTFVETDVKLNFCL